MAEMILVPFDGSPYAEQALVPACRLARQTGAAILLMQAITDDPLPAGPDYPLQVSEREAEIYLGLVQQGLQRRGIAAYVEVCRRAPDQEIIATAYRRDVDIIAMSSHGRSGPRQTLCGSVARRIIADPPVPLILVRTTDSAPAHQDSPYHHILLPLDGTASAEEALAYVQSAGLAQGAVLTLLQVVPHRLPTSLTDPRGYSVPLATDQAQIEAQHGQVEAYHYLDSAVRTQVRGISCRTRVVVGYPAKAILDVALAEKADLIVLAARDIGARPQRASASWHVLHNAQVPVLLLRAKAAAATVAAEPKVKQSTAVRSPMLGSRVAVLLREGDDD